MLPLSQYSNCSGFKMTGIRSWTSATNSFGSQIIIAHDFSRSPVSRFFHSSHSPAIVRTGGPSRSEIIRLLAVKRVVPFVISRHRHEAARALKRLAEERLCAHRLDACIEGCESQLLERFV